MSPTRTSAIRLTDPSAISTVVDGVKEFPQAVRPRLPARSELASPRAAIAPRALDAPALDRAAPAPLLRALTPLVSSFLPPALTAPLIAALAAVRTSSPVPPVPTVHATFSPISNGSSPTTNLLASNAALPTSLDASHASPAASETASPASESASPAESTASSTKSGQWPSTSTNDTGLPAASAYRLAVNG